MAHTKAPTVRPGRPARGSDKYVALRATRVVKDLGELPLPTRSRIVHGRCPACAMPVDQDIPHLCAAPDRLIPAATALAEAALGVLPLPSRHALLTSYCRDCALRLSPAYPHHCLKGSSK